MDWMINNKSYPGVPISFIQNSSTCRVKRNNLRAPLSLQGKIRHPGAWGYFKKKSLTGRLL
jgi:hypothetical protein